MGGRPLSLVVAILFAAACSEVVTVTPSPASGGAGGATDLCADVPASPLEGSACEILFQGSCSWRQRCGGADFEHLYGSFDDCMLWSNVGCAGIIGQPGQTWTEDDLRACGERLVNAPCDCFWWAGVCGDTHGTLPTGSNCGSDNQCASGHCEKPSGEQCGQCRPIPGLGEPCSFVCVDGLQCDSDDQCNVPKSAGEPCDVNGDCSGAEGLICFSGVCAPPLHSGDACSESPDQCGWWPDELTYCDGGVCVAYPLGDLGDPCNPLAANLEYECKGHLYCDGQLAVCRPRKDVGEPCQKEMFPSSKSWAPCRKALVCEAGACLLPAPFEPTCN